MGYTNNGKYERGTKTGEENAKILTLRKKIRQMGKIDVQDPEQLEQRIWDYFDLCEQLNMIPTVSGLGIAINFDRRRQWELATGYPSGDPRVASMPAECRRLLLEVREDLEMISESNLLEGNVRDAPMIFYMKNHFGYTDQLTHNVISDSTMLNSTPNREELEGKVLRILDDDEE